MIEGLEKKFREVLEDIWVSEAAIITEVYYDKMRVDVALKCEKEINGKVYPAPEILEVPISHNKSATFADRKMPEKGDVIWLVFTDRNLDDLIKDENQYPPKFDDILSEDNCFVVGEWTEDEERIPAELGSMQGDDWLLILHRKNHSRIYMRQNGNIVLEPGENELVELREDPKYSVPLYELVAAVYNSHSHPCACGPPYPQLTAWEKSHHIKVDR